MAAQPKRMRVVVVGAGFAGLQICRTLKRAPFEITLIDKNNYHLFQPLLYQVASAYIDPEQIAKPVRAIFRKQKNLTFRKGEVTGISVEKRQVQTKEAIFPYDILVIATGGKTTYFGLDGVERHGFGLKTLEDSINIRSHLLNAFEKATVERDETKRRALLTAVIGGGGSAGVETAGALAELVRTVISKDYPEFSPDDFRIVLCEMVDHLLPGFSPRLSMSAKWVLRRKGVDVRTGVMIEDYDGSRVRIKDGESIDAATLVWTAGIDAVTLGREAGLKTAKDGRIIVEPGLQVPGHKEIYAIGDGAYLEQDGTPVPMIAPTAIKMAETAGKNILRGERGKNQKEYTYKTPIALATIGRGQAVVETKKHTFKGFFAWLLWLFVHLIRLVGFRNRLVVLISWIWDYLFHERASRLILNDRIPEES